MNINDFMRNNRRKAAPGHPPRVRRLFCNDGFSMSIQASEFHYCEPRKDDAESYSKVEVGLPSVIEPLLLPYAEDKGKPTVYPYVPTSVVEAIVEKHGGPCKIHYDE